MSETKLLPCPFCGGEARKRLVEETIIHSKYWGVICNDCHCGTDGYQDYSRAVAAWNTRKPMDDIVEQEEYKELTITINQLTESNPKLEEFLNDDSPYTVEFTWCDNAVKNNGWISCSERLPEEAYGCLVTVMDYEPMTGQEFENILPYFAGYDGHAWYDSDGQEIPFEIIAWQPIPEPYQPKGE